MLDLNKFAQEVHDNAVDHGWWEEERKFPEIVALCHSELSEALEEYRAGNRVRPERETPMLYYSGKNAVALQETLDCKKPEGMAVEMADCIIRILDWCGKEGIDIEAILRAKHEYNKGRTYKHGGKKA